MEARRTYKYRLYRSKRDKHLVRQIEIASEIWNWGVALTRRYYSIYGKHLGYYRLKRQLAKRKKRDMGRWYGLNSQAGQNVIERLDKSYQRFFSDPKAGRPGFKKRTKYPSFTLTQTGWKLPEGQHSNRLRIGKHNFKFVLSRPIEGEVKTVTIKRDRSGDLWVCFSVAQDARPSMPQTGSAVGVDFGLKDFLVLSDGQTVESPQHLRASLKEMARLQRDLSRKKKGSNNREKARRRVAKLHRRIADQRRDFHFKAARAVLERHDFIAIEDLNLDGMKRLWGRKVSDLGFYSFVEILEHLATRNGKRVVKVDRYFASSKTCHDCGWVNKDLTLADREWVCKGCGCVQQRDLNAAKNIRDRALSHVVGDVRPAGRAVAA
ncbi:transposase [Rhodothermaceae bacterium RA]|nr:transposase [Rhodothermaceae bacterium RA]